MQLDKWLLYMAATAEPAGLPSYMKAQKVIGRVIQITHIQVMLCKFVFCIDYSQYYYPGLELNINHKNLRIFILQAVLKVVSHTGNFWGTNNDAIQLN